MPRRLKQLRFDCDNLPVLTPFEVEERAEVMLESLSPVSLERPGATSVPNLIDGLQSKYGVRFVLNGNLGSTPDGRRILGRINLLKKTIWIDAKLPDEGQGHRFNFMVAHEIGHLALHRHRPIAENDDLSDTNRELGMEFDHSASARDLAEWQANRYAAATLMPRETVRTAIIRFQTERLNPIRRNVGFVYLDDKQDSRALHAQTISHLSLVYQVSRTVARIRLKELGLLIDKRSHGSLIGDLLGDG